MKQNLMSKQIDMKEPVKGVLMSYPLMDLRIPLSYEVRLAPITTYSTGDYVSRTIQYSERESLLPLPPTARTQNGRPWQSSLKESVV